MKLNRLKMKLMEALLLEKFNQSVLIGLLGQL